VPRIVWADAWRLGLGTLTAVPVRPPTTVDRRRAGLAMLSAPLATLPLGLAAAAVIAIADRLGLPGLVTALLALAAVVAGNRALHLDGLSDTVDGLAASHDRDRSLAVMRSGTAGPAGVVAIVFVVGLQVAGLSSFLGTTTWWRGAVAAGVAVCLSRAALALCCLRGVPAAREDGLGLTYTQTVSPPAAALVGIGAAAVLGGAAHLIGLPWWRGPLAVAIAGVVVGGVVRRAIRRFGGVTGDVFGASIEAALATLLVAL